MVSNQTCSLFTQTSQTGISEHDQHEKAQSEREFMESYLQTSWMNQLLSGHAAFQWSTDWNTKKNIISPQSCTIYSGILPLRRLWVKHKPLYWWDLFLFNSNILLQYLTLSTMDTSEWRKDNFGGPSGVQYKEVPLYHKFQLIHTTILMIERSTTVLKELIFIQNWTSLRTTHLL